MTRCALRLADVAAGATGMAWVLGGSATRAGHAELAAQLDAMLQEPRFHDAVQREVIVPLVRAQANLHADAPAVEVLRMLEGTMAPTAPPPPKRP